MPSSLKSKTERVGSQLRSTSSQDNWGGDETVTLSVIDLDLKLHLEWAEGLSPRWDIWVFDENADIQQDDIILVESDGLALTVLRAATFNTFRGDFHHIEIVTEEHEHSVADLKTKAGL